uniref:Uncharacterized protein n=1 Tax=uncultured prokaryote TaxID=198431 RepID=A0A0H5Q5Z5_9ZZZZ|nr:hypothetical protein [uncultured prokaryote]
MTEAEDEILPSTTWEWRRVKIDPPLAAPTRKAAAGARRAPLSHWPSRTALTITVRYRGGAECWYEVKGRGRRWRVPGVLALHDVMEAVYGRGRVSGE